MTSAGSHPFAEKRLGAGIQPRPIVVFLDVGVCAHPHRGQFRFGQGEQLEHCRCETLGIA